MSMSYATGAVATKAKTMYGKRITNEDYEELLRRRNIGEITNYLKTETLFSESLKDVHENTVHRGQLESMLRQDQYKRMFKLIRFVDASHREFYMLSMKQVEIDQILARIRVITTKDFEEALADIPLFLDKHTKVNFAKLMLVKNFEQLLDVLKGTVYYETLKPFCHQQGEHFAYTACETALQKQYCSYVFAVIRKSFKGKTRKQLIQMYSTRVELSNITKIYRYKKFYHVPDNVIRESLIDCEGRIPKAQLDALIAQGSAEDFLKALANSPYHLLMDHDEYVYIEYFADTIQYHIAKRYIHYTTAAPLVFAAYQLLSTLEVDNLINIIEGIRYHVASEDIEKMLIY